MLYKKVLSNIFLVFTAVIFCAFPVCAKELKFAVVSDIDYANQSATDTDSDASKIPTILNAFVERVNENNYDFVVFLGDNIAKSNEKNLEGFLNIVKTVNTPYYLVMGNQDVHKISGLDKKEYLKIVSEHNKYQKKKDASYYFYPNKDVIVIVLDGVSSGMPTNHGVFSQNTLKWLDELLTKNEKKKAVIFQHVPYIAPYENPSYDILEKTDYRAVLSRHDNIIGVFAGHYKKESAVKDDNGVMHICVPALSQHPYSYLDMSLRYKKIPLRKAKDFVFDGSLKPAI